MHKAIHLAGRAGAAALISALLARTAPASATAAVLAPAAPARQLAGPDAEPGGCFSIGCGGPTTTTARPRSESTRSQGTGTQSFG